MDRKSIIESYREKRLTYVQIGKILGISKQRVHQIYKNYHSNNTNHPFKDTKCCLCGETENLQLHHIDGDTENNWKNNLLTACRHCHLELDKVSREAKGNKIIKYYKR